MITAPQTRRIRRIPARGALLVALLVLAASCGSSSDGTTAETAETTVAETTTAETAETTVAETTTADTAETTVAETTMGDTTMADTTTVAPDGTDVPGEDAALKIAGLPLGTTEETIVASLGNPATKSETIEEGATGEFVSDWTWPSAGVGAKMAAATPDGPRSVSTLTVEPPSALRTVQGLGLGDTEDAVRGAYGDRINEEESSDGSIVVGSIFGGMIFTITDGKVSAIFVGAAAE